MFGPLSGTHRFYFILTGKPHFKTSFQPLWKVKFGIVTAPRELLKKVQKYVGVQMNFALATYGLKEETFHR